jgi:hypothetical protein
MEKQRGMAFGFWKTTVVKNIKKIQFLPYGRSIGSWICLTHKTYTYHTVQNITDTHNIVLHNSQRYNLQKPTFVSCQGCVVHR